MRKKKFEKEDSIKNYKYKNLQNLQKIQQLQIENCLLLLKKFRR